MTIKQKLIAATVFFITVLIALGATIHFGYHYVTNKASLANDFDKESMYLQMMLRGLNEVIINDGTPSSLRTEMKGMEGFDEIHTKLMTQIKDPDIQKIMTEEIDPQWKAIKKNIEPFLEQYIDFYDDEIMVEAGKLIMKTENIIGHVEEFAEKSRAIVNKNSKISELVIRVMEFIFIPLLLTSVILAYHIYRMVTRPITELTAVAEGFNKGDLSVMMDESRDDEFGSLARYFNKSVVNLDQMSRQLQHSNKELFMAYDNTITGWSRAMDMRDKETEGHSQRVTEMTICIAREMGIKDDTLIHIRRGALLHDMGKLGVPDRILFKPGKLNDDEWVLMKKHPEFAYEMLYPIEFLRPSLDIPYCHHEKWDGSGYPQGLTGETIPVAARIFAVVDVWDALCSDRPYRPSWPKEKIITHIRSLSGTHFDPKVVDVFFQINWEVTSGELTIASSNHALPASYNSN